ncbi:MAG TPA: M1 family metallopeptidase [Chitinophagaceae bacterium]|nr:M1 family metallopeptidase [Chitinophagaceae bacterium]
MSRIFSIINISFLLILIFNSCTNTDNQEKTSEDKKETHIDHHSFSNFDQINFKHLDLDIEVSFDKKSISGAATWHFERKKEDVYSLILDTRDLLIDNVKDQNGEILKFEVGSPVPYLGQYLSIKINDEVEAVQIFYHSKPESEALQWLEPEQTFGKKQPFLYTQSETIYARSWIPSPDAPGIRFTYDAQVKVPKEMMALMSATNPQKKNNNGVYNFKMEKAIPAYLLALAVGDVEFKAFNDFMGVYAEKSILQDAFEEFKEIDQMVVEAEKLYGKYAWGRYDVLVLPPGFPFGGMENPVLTFLTPTIISGDKSLLNLIAHELAHSWSGNLVTNRTWEDFWLNEGFTTYFERRITEAIHGEEYTNMLWDLSLQSLKKSLEVLPARDTWLKLELKDRHPDIGLTDIAYDKGALFLRKIEEVIGRENMDSFLNSYFQHFAFQTINTDDFIEYFENHVLKDNKEWKKEIRLKDWIYGAGIPDNHPVFQVEKFKTIDKLIKDLEEEEIKIENIAIEEWTTYEMLHFLGGVQVLKNKNILIDIDKHWDLTHSNNMEILCKWLEISIENEYKIAYDRLDNFLDEIGRMKYLEVLYAALKNSNLGKQGTYNLYEQKKINYHPITQMEIENILNN